jgi:hypothetical protein
MVQLYYKGKNAGKVQIMVRGIGATNVYPQQPNSIPFGAITGIANNSWGQPNGWQGQPQTGGFNPQYNPYPPQSNPYMPTQPVMPQQPQQTTQWGNLNNNNGWGDFNPSPEFNKNSSPNNLYPSLDNTSKPNNNNFNPLNLMGQFIGQQVQTSPTMPNPNYQNPGYQNPGYQNPGYQNQNMPNNVPLQYQLINGMGMLNKGSYGNPYQ